MTAKKATAKKAAVKKVAAPKMRAGSKTMKKIGKK